MSEYDKVAELLGRRSSPQSPDHWFENSSPHRRRRVESPHRSPRPSPSPRQGLQRALSRSKMFGSFTDQQEKTPDPSPLMTALSKSWVQTAFMVACAAIALYAVGHSWSLVQENAVLKASNVSLHQRAQFLYEEFERSGREAPMVPPEPAGDELLQLVADDEDNDGEPDKKASADDGGGEEEVDEDEDGDEEGFAEWMALSAFLGASGYLALVIVKEVKKAQDKISQGDIEATLTEVLAYRIDYWFSSSQLSKPFALLGATCLLILVGGVLLMLSSGDSMAASMWLSWIYVADTAAHADMDDPLTRLTALVVTLGGMVVFGFMVGILTDVISEKVEDLKKGKSRVIETNHHLILGWSDKIVPVIEQIAIANESEGGGVVIVLAEREKEEMELEIMDTFGQEQKGTFVVVREGSPILMSDLRKVSAATAKSVIVLADRDVDADESDARALRIVLSLTGLGNLKGHIVCELCDVDNQELVHLVSDKVETIVSHDMIGRLMLQCTLQPGLALILEAMLGFEGCEFYIQAWPELVGLPFKDLQARFPDAVPIGLKAAKSNQMEINPPLDRVVEEGDELLVIAEDDDSYKPEDPVDLKAVPRIPNFEADDAKPMKMLFVGWRRDMDDMVSELDQFVPKNSELVLFSAVPVEEREQRFSDGGLEVDNLTNLTLVHVEGNPVLRRHLERLPLHEFNSVLILADASDEADMQTTDSRSLASLLLIRDIQSQNTDEDYREKRKEAGRMTLQRKQSLTSLDSRDQFEGESNVLISEILDSRTKTLISMASVSDYVASNELVSKVIAMVAEQREINAVLSELLSADGNETYVRDVRLYCSPGDSLSFYDMASRAQLRSEILVGYHRQGQKEVIVNPAEKQEPITWVNGDKLVVIADE